MSFIAAQSEATKPYLPVLIERLTIRTFSDSLSEFALAEGQGKADGLRSALGTSQMMDENGRSLLRAKVVFRSFEDHISSSDTVNLRQPYSHLVWKPDIDRLDQSTVREMFPNGSNNPICHEYIYQLEELSNLFVFDALERLPENFDPTRLLSHMQGFHLWLNKLKKALRENQASKMSSAERRERIQQILDFLTDEVPEAALLVRLNENLPGILQGKMDPLEVIKSSSLLDTVYEDGFTLKAITPQLQQVVKLIAHKEPRLRILEFGATTCGMTASVMTALQGRSRHPVYVDYTFTASTSSSLDKARDIFKDYKNMGFRILDIEKELIQQGFEESSYDIVFMSTVFDASLDIANSLGKCRKLLKPEGKLVIVSNTTLRLQTRLILGTIPDYWQWKDDSGAFNPHVSERVWESHLIKAGFSGVDLILHDYDRPDTTVSVIVSTMKKQGVVTNGVAHPTAIDNGALWLIYRHNPHPLLAEIKKLAEEKSLQTKTIPLYSSPDIPKGSRVIMMADLEGDLLSAMDKTEMSNLGTLFTSLSSAIWLTNGGLLNSKDPEKSMIFGMAKSIMKAQPSFTLCCIDFEPEDKGHSRLADIVIQQEFNLRQAPNDIVDTELIVRNGVIYISRFIADDIENANFSRQTQIVPEKIPVGGRKLSLDFQKVGQVGSFYFKEELPGKTEILDDEVHIAIRAYALTKTEASILKVQLDSSTFSHECVGKVTGIGSKVTRVKLGQQVLCLAAGKFSSTFITTEDLCIPLRPDKNVEEVLGLILPYCTARKMLLSSASRKTVLVHMKPEILVVEVVLQAREQQSTIFATYTTESEKNYLQKNCAIPERYLICASSASFIDDIHEATGETTIDTVIASSDSRSLEKIWSCLGANGNFVLLTEAGIPDLSLFDPSVFIRGVTISSVNFLEMVRTKSPELKDLMQSAFSSFETRRLANPPPLVVFDMSDLEAAVQKASDPTHFGRVILKQSPKSIVPIQAVQQPLKFNPEASYLLVGGLGGLGRSLTTWMTSRGARHFIFLSRSGSSKPSAQALLSDLHAFSKTVPEPMSIQVIRGDVSIRADVDRAITAASKDYPVKGVIQAAMVTTASLFENMSLDEWNTMIRPKVHGTRNLHEALLGHEPLDFFVLTSSLLGVLGASTQTYYAAANAYLDSFARHRWSLGLQATSIALGGILGVGHVEENPDVESALGRNGLEGIPESEFLKMMECAMRKKTFAPSRCGDGWDDAARAHLVTGLEPSLISKAARQWIEDPRLRHVSLAIQQQARAAAGGEDFKPNNSAPLISTAALLHQARSDPNPNALKSLIRTLVLAKFSSLVHIPVEKLEDGGLGKPLAEFGMDSMITAELRTWGWRELRSDVPFMKLLGGGLSVGALVEVFFKGMGRVGG